MYTKNLFYRDIPFSPETPHEDFFICDIVKNLFTRCESNRDVILKIRTVGVLINENGRFFLRQMNTIHNLSTPPDPRECIQVSLAHMHSIVRCTSLPQPVQLHGRLQWKGCPVIFAQIIQPLSVSVASILNETMLRVALKYSSKQCSFI